MDVSQLGDSHAAMHAQFRWLVPQHFNIAQVCGARWAQAPDAAQRAAIIVHAPQGEPVVHSYAALQQAADRLSSALAQLGVRRGDRVALVLPQRFETAAAYLAVLQMGAVATPLSMLFGPEALQYRLHDSEAVVALCDAAAIDRLAGLRAQCPQLRTVIGVGAPTGRADRHWDQLLAQAAPGFRAVDTLADDAAVLIYTSGTTGNPKGALIPHRALIGNLSGFVCSQNWFGFDPADATRPSQAVFWSPADWAWTGGLMDALLPTLYFGRPIVACAGRFSPEQAFALMQQHGVTHSFLFPTALKAMMKAYPEPGRHFRLRLQAIMSAGEAMGDAVFAYCGDQLGVVPNEMFGQTEINYVVGNCAMNRQVHGAAQGRPRQGAAPSGGSEAHEVASVGALGAAAPGRPKRGAAPSGGSEAHEVASVGAPVGWPARPGSMGRPYPGHRVAVIDEQGRACAAGVQGEVAVHRLDRHGYPDPVFFLGYWKNEAATRLKFGGQEGAGDWCRTGDLAVRDADGYLWYRGRADDQFKSAGYRIGPGEIENCLVKHAAVANAAVVPKPDRERGALVKAYVVLTPAAALERGDEPFSRTEWEARLVAELQQHVKGRLAPYEYPKEIEFIDALPMTTTGKVQRRVLREWEEERARAEGLGSPTGS